MCGHPLHHWTPNDAPLACGLLQDVLAARCSSSFAADMQCKEGLAMSMSGAVGAQAAMQAGQRQREWQAGKFPGEAGKALRGCGAPEWLVAEAPRAALLSAAQSVIR